MVPKCIMFREFKKILKSSLESVCQVFVLVWQVFGVGFVTRGSARCKRINVFTRKLPVLPGEVTWDHICVCVPASVGRQWKDGCRSFSYASVLRRMEQLCPRCPPLHAPCPRAVTPLNTLCSKLLFQAHVAVPEMNTPVMLPRAWPSHGERIASCVLCTPGLSVHQIYMVSTYTHIHTFGLMVLSASPAICWSQQLAISG